MKKSSYYNLLWKTRFHSEKDFTKVKLGLFNSEGKLLEEIVVSIKEYEKNKYKKYASYKVLEELVEVGYDVYLKKYKQKSLDFDKAKEKRKKEYLKDLSVECECSVETIQKAIKIIGFVENEYEDGIEVMKRNLENFSKQEAFEIYNDLIKKICKEIG
jgi:hypothetical protein